VFISSNVPIMRKVHLDTCSGARHLERTPAQHGQTCDPQEEPAQQASYLLLLISRRS
jgi:hypothetical protein